MSKIVQSDMEIWSTFDNRIPRI